MNSQKIILAVVGLLFALGVVIILAGVVTDGPSRTYDEITVPDGGGNSGGRACTEEAKICPDGSAVGRTGPNCEFAACPVGGPAEDPGPLGPPLDDVLGLGEARCLEQGGSWDGTYSECLGVDALACAAIDGQWNECASACRHNPEAEMCTMQCVQVCTVPQ